MSRTRPTALSSLESAIANVPVAMALVDASSHRYVATNQAFDELLAAPGKTMAGEKFDELIPLEMRKSVLQDYDAVATGRLEGYEAQRRLIRPSGGEVSGEIWVRRLDVESSRPLTAAIFLPSRHETQSSGQRAIFGDQFSEVAFLVTDHDWTIEYASRDIETVLGVEPSQLLGKPLLGAIRPAMAADFLLSITRVTTTKRTVMTHAELRADSQWRHCICLITALCDHSPPKLGLAIISAGDDAEATKPSRAKQLEQHMWRIAAEVMAARLLPPVSDTLAIDRAGDFAELTSHQFEITMRLINGERVPAIAKAIHLSPSTVRNHLSAVFRRFGVHSQGELISLLRDSRQSP